MTGNVCSIIVGNRGGNSAQKYQMILNSNKTKAGHGAEFIDDVLKELKHLRSLGIINKIDMKKKIPFTEGNKPQFYAPFIVSILEKRTLIFTMTSMRSDRNKINQWDAYGIKNFYKNNIKVIVVLPDILSEKELKHFLKEKEKIHQDNYLTAIDEICQLADLKSVLIQ
ncbi:hypothetical protein ACFLRX_08255 [Acidobacteriota bacterium]